MTKKQYQMIREDIHWVKITYVSPFSKGTMKMKETLYNLRYKHIHKLLKGCTYHIHMYVESENEIYD